MELRHLRYFTAVAEERHFGRAARRLRMAQPPLSRQIQALEVELGFQLFDRSRRRVELTSAGTVFLAETRRVFEAVDGAVREARRASVGEIGRVVIGYLSSLAYSGIVELIQRFHAAHPAIDLSLREQPPLEQIEGLRQGRLDVGFLRGPLDDASLSSEVLRREPLVIALPAAHPLAARKRLALAAIAKEPFITFPRQRGPAFFDQLMGMCRAAGFTPRIVQEAPHFDIISLVAAGFGVSIMPASIMNIGRAGLALRPIVGSPTTDLLMAWRATDQSPAVYEFLSFVRRARFGRMRA